MTPDPDASAFFDAYQRCFAPLKVVLTARTPREMLVSDRPDESGWVEWRVVPCASDLAHEFAEIERQLGRALPTSFKRFYGSFHVLDLDLGIVRLPANPSNAPLGPLRDDLFNAAYQRPRDLGLIPFGGEALMDAGPLCLDPRASADPEQWPVRYWDHEWAGEPGEVGPPIFSSFEKLLACCTRYLTKFVRVKASAPDDPTRWRKERGRCIESMLDFDPAGAGGPGRLYWQSWTSEEVE